MMARISVVMIIPLARRSVRPVSIYWPITIVMRSLDGDPSPFEFPEVDDDTTCKQIISFLDCAYFFLRTFTLDASSLRSLHQPLSFYCLYSRPRYAICDDLIVPHFILFFSFLLIIFVHNLFSHSNFGDICIIAGIPTI